MLLVAIVACVSAVVPTDSDNTALAEVEAWRAYIGTPCGGGCPAPLNCNKGECCPTPATDPMQKLSREILIPISQPKQGHACGGPEETKCTNPTQNCLIVDKAKDAEGFCFPLRLVGDCGGSPQRLCPDHYQCLIQTSWPKGNEAAVGHCVLQHYDHPNKATLNRDFNNIKPACQSNAVTCPEVFQDCASRVGCSDGYECVFPDNKFPTPSEGKCHPIKGFKCDDPAKDCAGLNEPKSNVCTGKWQCLAKKCVWLCPDGDAATATQTTAFFF